MGFILGLIIGFILTALEAVRQIKEIKNMKEIADKTPLRDLKTVTIVFDDVTSHAEIVTQFVSKLEKAKFANRKEIIEHLMMADVLTKDY